ncbi:MAG: Asp-tRNA(Asn)/Glu-tRNA(Gln) amidotransferase subunit GatB [Candidatus Yanofskybacteria bacterium]|nr:Asp-tRNA(Asn)/Glu-tRNA(Gln) amidotransferase subunit GatB [Candidatus Yanofskybacteria bacterium]
MRYIPTIGLEIHVELKTKTKMFCDSLNNPDEKHPNVNVCPVCMGHPGTLPVINEEALKKIMMVGLALNCYIAKDTFFERKNYFYPDLPKGYQISQFQKPLCYEGYMDINNPSTSAQGSKRIRIERIHLEEDAGRLYHLPDKDYTLVDFNRAGLPLMELVTKPDLETASDVYEFATELRLLLRYLGASDADMEKGQMRVEVNISLRPDNGSPSTGLGRAKLGTKVEVKNINSITAAAKAVEYEVGRQSELLNRGEKITQETRGWDDVHNRTVSQRIKEGSADYRYFPEPDLPPLSFDDSHIEGIRAGLPELPQKRQERFLKEYGLPERDVKTFTTQKPLGDYFEKVASELLAFDNLSHLQKPGTEHQDKVIKLASNYVITELNRMFDEISAEPDDTKVSPEAFADLIVRIFHGEVSSSGAQAVLKEMFATGRMPGDIIKEKDLGQLSNIADLNKIVEDVIMENKQAVEDYKKGRAASMKFLVGKVMATSKGKANPQVVAQMLEEKLKSK